MLDLPGFQELDDLLMIYWDRRSPVPPPCEEAAVKLSVETFGIRHEDTRVLIEDDGTLSDAEWNRLLQQEENIERRFKSIDMDDEMVVKYLLSIGFDFRQARGQPLLSTSLFARQAEAAALGIRGARMPDLDAVAELRTEKTLQRWVDAWKRRG
ncbi:MAG: hypothetical protein MEP57_07220 [Microvirga sp.]|nr:hypothetical protein [Microvirga sp.]